MTAIVPVVEEIGPDVRPLDINLDFGEDYYTASGLIGSELTPFPAQISIDGVGFTVDTKELEITTVDMLRGAQDTGAEPGEQSLSSAGAWKRSRIDWSLGAGQEWADEKESDPRRYWTSLGIDPWSRREFCLLPDTAVLQAGVPGGHWKLLATHGAVYATNGGSLWRCTALDTTSPVIVDVHGVSTGVLAAALATDGQNVYYSDSTGLCVQRVEAAVPGVRAPGAAATIPWSRLYWWQGFLLGVKADPTLSEELYLIARDGTPSLLYKHPVPDFAWTAAVGTPYALYVGGQPPEGTGEIYRWVVKDDGTLPSTPPLAASLPRNEQVEALAAIAGARLLVIGTSLGVRAGEISQDATVTFGPVIATPNPVRCLWPEAEYVCFGWSNFDTEHTGLGRLHLTEFTDTLVPAYSSDVMAQTTQGVVDACTCWDMVRLFGVAGGALWTSTDELVESGWLDNGAFTWTTYDPKSFIGAELVHDPLIGQVALEIHDHTGRLVAAETRSAQGSTGLGIDMLGPPPAGNAAEWLRPVIHLIRDTPADSEGSCVHRLTMRSIPMLRQVTMFNLPLVVSEQIDLGVEEGQDQIVDTLSAFLWLKGLEQSARAVTVQIGQLATTGTVNKVDYPRGFVRGFTSRRRWLDGIILVELMLREL